MSVVSGSETEQGLAASGVKPLAVPRRLLRMRSDAALAERFALGDEAAFDVIYERHRPVVLAVCMGVLGTPPDAEDATQETFSALAVALRTRPPAELRPWLIRVARNASIDTTRRRRHRLLTLDGEIPEVAARPAGGGQAELAVVLDGIRELPEGQRMALLMRELGGHSYAEIAEFLATDEEAVKGLIARARVGLRTYREATELSCSTARSTISAEPDGRRYDKTIRRHLRGCASCRGYRDALRDDAKALRAALPIQAGTVATGSLSSGMLSAAKGSLLGYGLTQAATTCAASACAVGAIGGMVFVAPVHKLGLPPILPPKSAPAHRHAAVNAGSRSAAAPSSHYAVTVSHSAVTAPSTPATGAGRPAITHRAVVRHHVKVTKVSLPALPRHHRHAPTVTNHQATPATPSTTSVTTQTTVVQSVTPVTQSSPAQTAQSPTVQSATQTGQTGSSQGSQSGNQGHGSSRWGGSAGNGGPQHSTGATGGFTSAGATTGSTTSTTTTPTTTGTTTTPTTTGTTTAPTSTTPTSTTPTTTNPTTTSPTTTSPTTNPVVSGGGHNHGGYGQTGSRHGANGRPGTTTTQSTTSTQPTTTTTTTSTTAGTTTTSGSSSSSNGWGHGWGSGSHGNHG